MQKLFQNIQDFHKFITNNDSETVKNIYFPGMNNQGIDLFEFWLPTLISNKSSSLTYMIENNMVNYNRDSTVEKIMYHWWNLMTFTIKNAYPNIKGEDIFLYHFTKNIPPNNLYTIHTDSINSVDEQKISNDKFPFSHFLIFSHWNAFLELLKEPNAYEHLESKSLQNRNILHSIILHLEKNPRNFADSMELFSNIEKIISINYKNKDDFNLTPSNYMEFSLKNIHHVFEKNSFYKKIQPEYENILDFLQKQELYYELQLLEKSNTTRKNHKI